VYYYLTRAVKSRLILELQDSFAAHPEFKKLVPYIQNKFAYEEKPQFGIVVKNTSASKIQMSADNFIGTVIAHCQKAHVENHPGVSAEWIREDTQAIRANDGEFPSPPGIYYAEVTAVNTEDFTADFVVNPLLDVFREFLFEVSDSTPSDGHVATVSSAPIHEGTLYVYADDVRLVEGTHYTVNLTTGEITFTYEAENYTRMYVNYKYPTAERGPYTVGRNSLNNTAVPGVVIAFGRQMTVGDQFAIIITPKRTIAAQEYGGKWEVSVSFDVLARDPIQLEEISDLVLMYLWGQKKDILEYSGLIIQDVAHGGEADEVYDETGQEMYYLTSMDLTIQTDWNIHVPVPFYIEGIEFVEGGVAPTRTMSDEEIVTVSSTLRIVPSLTPYMPKTALTHNYERIA
jgi:hypothetical protein